MRKILLAFLMLFGVSVYANDDALWEKSTLNQIIKRGELIVATEPGYIPFEMKNKRGEIIGFDVDIARAMADAMGVKLKLVPTDWESLIPTLNGKSVDIIISGMTIFQERNLRVNFANSYMKIGQTLLVQPKHANKKWQDLDKSEFTIVTKLGTAGDVASRRIFKNAKLKTFNSEAEAVQEVLNKNADIFIFDKPFNDMFMLQKGKNMVVHLSEPLTYEPLGWAIRKGDPDFLNWLNNFLNQIQNDGTYEKIYDKWFVSDKWLEQVM